MAKATYENIRKLCSGAFSRKQTLQCAPATSAGEMNADRFKSLSYEVQKYEFLTNPSHLAGWPLGLTTMSIVGGQINNIQPIWVAEQPIDHKWSQTSREEYS